MDDKDKGVKNYDGPSGWEAAEHGDEGQMDAIVEHVEKYFGKVDNVFHEILSDAVHIDVHIINPTDERKYYTLFTTGMSYRPMNAPEGCEQFSYGELIMHLPPDWDVKSSEDNDYWPIFMLKFLARFPHKYNTWIFFGHTIPNGADAEPFGDNTDFGCMILGKTIMADEEFAAMKLGDKTIYFMTMLPIYKEEMEFKLENGSDALWEILSDNGVGDIIDINRVNACEN